MKSFGGVETRMAAIELVSALRSYANQFHRITLEEGHQFEPSQSHLKAGSFLNKVHLKFI